MLGHRSKAFTLTLDEENRTLDGFMDEQKKIPFKTLDFFETRASSFYSHPLLPSFLQTYGPQINWIHTPSGFFLHPNAEAEVDEVPPEKELAFYQGLPNLIHLCLFTYRLWENVLLPTIEEEKLPFLRKLQSISILLAGYGPYDSCEVIGSIDFLRHCPNLRKLSLLSEMPLVESVKVLTALGDYFAARNGWKGGIPPTLKIFIPNTTLTKQSRHEHLKQLREIEEGMANKLLEELAASDGRILIENMPITLLDGAVRLFSKQRQLGKLRSFGKCITSLIGFSDSLYEVELPNMRILRVDVELIFLGKEREGDYTKTVNWPKLERIELRDEKEYWNYRMDSESDNDDSDDNDDMDDADDNNDINDSDDNDDADDMDDMDDSESDDDDDAPAVPVQPAPAVPVQPAPVTEDLISMKKLVFESGLRATVQRLDCEFVLHFLSWDDEAPHLLRNLPNLTLLTLSVNEEDADSFRSLLRILPTSSPKLELLEFTTHFLFKDEDFLGMGDDGSCCVPPLLKLSGNYYQ
jgi:hypothetical protein